MSEDARALRVGWPLPLFAVCWFLGFVAMPVAFATAPFFVEDTAQILWPFLIAVGTDVVLGVISSWILLARLRRLQQGTYGAARLYLAAIATLLYAAAGTGLVILSGLATHAMSSAEITLMLAGRDDAWQQGVALEAAQTAALGQGTLTAILVLAVIAGFALRLRDISMIATWFLMPERVRQVFWGVFDTLLTVALIFVLWTQEIRPPDDAVDLTPYILSFAVYVLAATRLFFRAIPFALDVIERMGFASLAAARLLRARKSGFLSLIGFFAILAVSFSSCALTTTLSVMGGFREDLRQKILGNHAHVVIDREYGNFEGWGPILERVREVEGVEGAAPYVSGEVMLTSASNIAGTVLRGIDPGEIGNVTDLPRYITVGRLEYLSHPEMLLDLDPDEMSGGITSRSRRRLARIEDEEGEGASDAGPAPDGGVLLPPRRADAPTDPETSGILRDIDRLLADLDARDADGHEAAHEGEPLRDRPLPEREPPPEIIPGLGSGIDVPPVDVPALADGDELGGFDSPFDSPFEDDGFDSPLGELGVPAPLRQPRDVLPGIVVGQELARSLRLHVGDEVNVVSPTGDLGPAGPMPRSRPFRVAAIFYSGMYEYDVGMAYTDLASAQRFLSVGDAITGIEVKVADWERADRWVMPIEAALDRDELRARSWQEVNRNLFGALALEKLAMFITLGLAILVASFCIIGTLVLMVQEKGREVGILKAMGARDGAIITAFMIQGLLIGLVGATTGLGLGWALCFSLENFNLVPLSPEVYYIDHLPVHIDPGEFVSVGVAAVVISLLATIYPAILGSRLKPVDALRDG